MAMMDMRTFLSIFIILQVFSAFLCISQISTPNASIYKKLSLSEMRVDPDMKRKFDEFKSKFGKSYDHDDVEVKSYLAFEDNMKRLNVLKTQVKRTNPNSDLVLGITPLVGIPYGDFKKSYLSLIAEDFSKIPTKSIYQNSLNPQSNSFAYANSSMQKGLSLSGTNNNSNNLQGSNTARDTLSATATASTSTATVYTLPDNFDYNQQNLVSSVKDQGSCGSCWAFATVGVVESMYLIKKGICVALSEQQLISCNFSLMGNFGCKGGQLSTAFNYVKSAKGLTPSNNYPYAAQYSACATKNIVNQYPILDYKVWDNKYNEDIMARILVEYGVAAVAVEASTFFGYVSGIIDSSIGCTNKVNHAVVLVGYGVDILNGVLRKYWVIKNSWGTAWGEKGFLRIERGTNACGIASQMVTITLP